MIKNQFGFVFFLLFAAVLWFVFRYQQNYTQIVDVHLHMVHVPPQYQVPDHQKTIKIPLQLSGTGFSLLKATFLGVDVFVPFDQMVDDKDFIFTPSQVLPFLRKDLNASYQIELVDNQKQHLEVYEINTKKVAVSLQEDLPVADGIAITKVSFNPDTLLLSGDEEVLDSLQQIKLDWGDDLITEGVFEKKIPISFTKSNVQSPINEVLVKVTATRVTEGEMEIPVQVLGVPEGVVVKSIPSTVHVIYTAAIHEFVNINAADFKIEVWYHQLQESDTDVVLNLQSLTDKVMDARMTTKSAKLLIIE